MAKRNRTGGRRIKDSHRRLAREVFWEEYDRENYKCPDCGRTETDLETGFEVHHKGGHAMDNRPENLIALCRPCHNLREGKKPSINEIQNILDQVNAVEESETVSDEEKSTTKPISTIADFNGRLGNIVCPGCNEALGHTREGADLWLHHHCCGVEAWEVPTAAVIDEDLDEHIGSEGLKSWMVDEWIRFLKSNGSMELEQPRHVGWKEAGEGWVPQLEHETVEVEAAGTYLSDIRMVAENWGWDHVAYSAKRAIEDTKPGERAEAFAFHKVEDPPGSIDDEELVSLGEFL